MLKKMTAKWLLAMGAVGYRYAVQQGRGHWRRRELG